MLWFIWFTIVAGFVLLYLFVSEATKRIRIGIVALLNRAGDQSVDRADL